MTQTRKPRRKATTDLGKSIMQRERQRLAREQAALAEKLAADAVESRKLAVRQAVENPVRDADRAIQRSIVRRVAGVLASEGVNPSITVESISSRQPINAWTDFSQIYVGYHVHKDVRLTAAVLRGLFYHEGGHIRFTVPFPTLTAMAAADGADVTIPGNLNRNQVHHAWNLLEDQRMETAVVSDSPRKAGYFVPMVLSELALTVNDAAANWPLMVWRRYLPSKVVAGARKLFVIKNGEHGEEYAQQIEQIVDTYVQSTDAVTMHTAVIDMANMLQVITPLSYNLNNAGHQNMRNVTREPDPDALLIPIDPSMIPEPCEDEDEPDPDAFDPYHLLQVIIAAWNAPETLVNIQYVVNTTEDAEEDPTPSNGNSPQPSAPEEDEDEADEPEDEPEDEEEDDEPATDNGTGKDSKDSKPEADNEADDDEDDSDDDGKGDDDTEDDTDDSTDEGDDDDADEGGSTGTHDDDGADNEDDYDDTGDGADEDEDDLTDEDLRETLAEAEDERLQDPTLDQDVKSFADSRHDAASKLDIYTGGRSTDVMAIAEASNLADEMQRAFEAATVDMAPAWHEQQRRGIVNVLRYQTRQPGDVEFFKGFVDNGNPGCDIAVSLLLDYSGSMGSAMEALAKVAYASKAACDRLDVPCTVVLWDTEARVLWDASERAEYLPVICDAGGTNPAIALADLDNQMYGKSKHIVMIMTDDDWSSQAPSLAAFRQEGRTIIGLGYNSGWSEGDIAESMRKKGADAAYQITDLEQIPRYLEQTLSAMA